VGFRVSVKSALNLDERKLVVRWGLGGARVNRPQDANLHDALRFCKL